MNKNITKKRRLNLVNILLGNLIIKSALILTISIIGIAKSYSAIETTFDTANITISGLSSGGFMANQYHLSNPQQVSGAGIIAAGPYKCARNSLMTAFSECISKTPDKYPDSIINISAQFSDQSKFLQNDRVWMFHGTLDSVIVADVSDALQNQYSQIIQTENLRYINDKPFAHLFPTQTTGVDCKTSEPPFIGNCGYDAAGEMLNYLLGSLKPKASKENVSQLGELIKFEQSKLTDLAGTGMHQFGYAYIPTNCNTNNIDKSCRIHVSFHGCKQSIEYVEDQYASDTGINEWAATNDIVVVYPQVAVSSVMPMNPQACWDWWGYTDENYANKNGKQIMAVKEILLGLKDSLQ